MEEYKTLIKNLIVDYGTSLIWALAILIVGLWITGVITKSVRKMFEKRGIDPSLQPFLVSMINMLLKTLVVIMALSKLGIEMTSFVAILGAAGLAVGMALSGTLQNFAGGVMILIFKPFKVGDFIEASGYLGVVKEIQIFVTIINTVDNKTVIIPNGGLSTGSMINYSAEETRRVDFTFGIAYGDDVEKAKAIMHRVMKDDPRVLKDPETFVGLAELADSSVNFTARAWVKSDDYWDVFFDVNEKMYAAFNAEGINIPFPQMDLHVNQVNG